MIKARSGFLAGLFLPFARIGLEEVAMDEIKSGLKESKPRGVLQRGSYLPQCIDQMVFESHPPHKIVNLLFTVTHPNNKLTILWGR
jgi:hypothetical protein